MNDLSKSLRTDLTDGLQRFNHALDVFGERLYRLYQSSPSEAAGEFLKAVRTPHEVQKGYLKAEGLNPGSSAGLVMEWFFFHIINEAIKAQKPTETYAKKVYNNYELPYKWKKVDSKKIMNRSHKQIMIDIAVWSEKPKRLLYCIEVKTNFEDGFSKYCREWKLIHHHRERSYKPFRYHYVSLNNAPKGISEKYQNRIERQLKREEIWAFPKDNAEAKDAIKRAERFLWAIYEPLKFDGRAGKQVRLPSSEVRERT